MRSPNGTGRPHPYDVEAGDRRPARRDDFCELSRCQRARHCTAPRAADQRLAQVQASPQKVQDSIEKGYALIQQEARPDRARGAGASRDSAR